MSADTGSWIGRLIVVALLMAGTLGFGLAGLCGAAFTALMLPEISAPGSYAGAALIFSIPSLLIGAPLAWLCGRKLLRMLRDKQR